MSRTVDTSISIAAPASAVWEILTDFDAYQAWNPFLVSITGRPVVGSRLRISLVGADGRRFTFRPRVLVVDAPRRLEWKGRALVPGVFTGHHRFRLEDEEGGCVLRQTEVFTGFMVAPVWRFTAAETRAGFAAMNEAIRTRAEA